jgi:hypothetical protein
VKTWVCNTLASFFGPLQGSARLYAYLRKEGHDVCLKDFNQDAYFALLSRECLEQTLEKLRRTVDATKRSRFLREDVGSILLHSSSDAARQLLAKGILTGSPWYRFIKTGNAVKKPVFRFINSRIKPDNVFYALLNDREFVLSEVEKAREVLDKQFLSLAPDEFFGHFYTLLCGKALIDAAYFPAQLDFGLGFHGTAYAPSGSDIMRYYRQHVMPLFIEERPDIVGISITHTSEFVPAFTLAHLMKAEHPEAHICLGGAAVTEVAHRVSRNLPLWDCFDSLIMGPGEYAFSELIERLEEGEDLSAVPNAIYREKDSIRKSDKILEFDINDACTPEYVSLRPKSGLPLETASGCYWGRCIFCYYPKQGTAGLDPAHQKKRVRNIELVLEDIRKLRDRYDPIYIGLTDSSLHPRRIEQIAEQNLSGQRKANFSAFIRFEKEFKSPAFCQKLADGGFLGGQVGLESGSQRVNDIINKGVDLDDARIIIGNLYRAGVLVHLYSLIGLPGETMEEAAMTFDFLKRWHHRLTLDWQLYSVYILEHSPLAKRAAEFGLSATPLPDDYLVEAMRHTVNQGLSQEESTTASIRFNEKLKRFLHPANKIMDIESVKLVLLAQKSKGVNPDQIKKIHVKI